MSFLLWFFYFSVWPLLAHCANRLAHQIIIIMTTLLRKNLCECSKTSLREMHIRTKCLMMTNQPTSSDCYYIVTSMNWKSLLHSQRPQFYRWVATMQFTGMTNSLGVCDDFVWEFTKNVFHAAGMDVRVRFSLFSKARPAIKQIY